MVAAQYRLKEPSRPVAIHFIRCLHTQRLSRDFRILCSLVFRLAASVYRMTRSQSRNSLEELGSTQDEPNVH